MDTERFIEYVRTCLVPVLGNYWRKEPHSVVIMDNCSIHIDKRVRELIENAGAILIYSAPYCPELIPIEYMFHQWKAYLKRHSLDFKNNFFEVHMSAIMSVTPQQGLNYFKKTALTELVENHPLSESNMELATAVATVVILEELL